MPAPSAPTVDERARLAALGEQIDTGEVLRMAEGEEVHFVGGAVRDALLDRPLRDLDLTVARQGERLAQRLSRRFGARLVRLGGARFASFRLVGRDLVVDLWDRKGASLDDDLARRDLTINAMALSLAAGAPLHDPVAGLVDLRAGRLRATTSTAFLADPLRVLRLARLVGEIEGAAVDAATLALARAAAAGLAGVANERIREELERLLAAPRAAAGFETLEAAGAGWALFGAAGLAAAAALAVDEIDHAVAGLRREVGIELAGDALRLTRLAALARAADAAPAAERFLEQLASGGRLSRQDARAAALLVTLPPAGPTEREMRRFLHAAGERWPAGLVLQLASGAVMDGHLVALRELDRAHGDALRRPQPLLRGRELAELAGLTPGRELGALAGALRAAQVDGLVETREEALAWLSRRIGSRPGSPSERGPRQPE